MKVYALIYHWWDSYILHAVCSTKEKAEELFLEVEEQHGSNYLRIEEIELDKLLED
jgi:hypothetical protein